MNDKIPLALEEYRHINLRLVGPGGRAVKASATLQPEQTKHNSLDRLQIRKPSSSCSGRIRFDSCSLYPEN
jgi:hypothetical protein